MKLTPWFPGHVAPARHGIYERRTLGYAYWDGSEWSLARDTVECAFRKRHVPSIYQLRGCVWWRGILKDSES